MLTVLKLRRAQLKVREGRGEATYERTHLLPFSLGDNNFNTSSVIDAERKRGRGQAENSALHNYCRIDIHYASLRVLEHCTRDR